MSAPCLRKCWDMPSYGQFDLALAALPFHIVDTIAQMIVRCHGAGGIMQFKTVYPLLTTPIHRLLVHNLKNTKCMDFRLFTSGYVEFEAHFCLFIM